MRTRAVLASLTVVAAVGGSAIAQAAGKPVKITAGKYAGTTSERGAVTFTISGRSIKQFKTLIGYNGKCGQGGGPGFTITVGAVAIKANGTFSTNVTLVGPVQSVKNQKGTLSGRVTSSAVRGQIVDSTLASSKCNGYTETFAATRTG
jgi:hypothetical protein